MYPALAWWNPDSTSGASILAHPEGCLKQFAAHTLNTDWGLRDVSSDEKIYDGMSYHQGSVWPLFTGWTALAEYRANQPLTGYQMLMENANLTRAQDLAADTELLSGDFFVPLGRSTSHQLWSSAMVITPTLRGLFGISVDAQTKTITVNPHLPANWDDVSVDNLPSPAGVRGLKFHRSGSEIEVSLTGANDSGWNLRTDLIGARTTDKSLTTLRIASPQIEIGEARAAEIDYLHAWSAFPFAQPLPSARTARFRVVEETYADHKLTLVIEGPAGGPGALRVIRHGPLKPKAQWNVSEPCRLDMCYGLAVTDMQPESPMLLEFVFPPGEGWKTITVTLTW